MIESTRDWLLTKSKLEGFSQQTQVRKGPCQKDPIGCIRARMLRLPVGRHSPVCVSALGISQHFPLNTCVVALSTMHCSNYAGPTAILTCHQFTSPTKAIAAMWP